VEVRSGESLYDIARAHRYALEHLADANQLPISLAPLRTREILLPARRILPTNPPKNGIVVNIPERGFYLFRDGEEARFFPIAVGEPGRFATPTGNYSILEKVKNPEWVAPEWAGLGEDNVIPAGPDNPLGDRWLGLSSAGLGMHSTNNPSSIGSATSHGCMRMYPEVAREVFDLVEAGWPVRIEYETSRVALSKDGIFVATYSDPYHLNRSGSDLRSHFEALDLGGFLALLDEKKLHQPNDGVVRKVVNFDTRVRLPDGTDFPATRIGDKLYIDGESLIRLGAAQQFHLAGRTVSLNFSRSNVKLPILLTGDSLSEVKTGKESAVLSRGTAWYPAKTVLRGLNIPYRWQGDEKLLLIGS